MLDEALAYAAQGWPVVPLHGLFEDGSSCTCGSRICPAPGKHPILRDWPKAASVDAAQITEWSQLYPWMNIGIATGARAGFFVVDIDPRNEGHVHLRELEVEHGDLPTTLTSRTGGGGEHRFFQLPPGLALKSKLCTGVDIKSDGGQIVAPPSRHVSGKSYAWVEPLEPLAEAPEWLIQALRRKKNTPGASPTRKKRIREGSRNEVLCSLAGSMRAAGFEPDAIAAALLKENLSKCAPPLAEAEVLGIANGMARYAPEPTSLAVQAQEEDFAWMTRLAQDKNGNPRRSLGNAGLIFENDPAWQGVLGFNDLKQQPVFTAPPPYARKWTTPQLTDEDLTEAAKWIEYNPRYRFAPSRDDVRSALYSLARANSFDPLVDYLCALEYDGRPRVDTWLHDYCGVIDTPYTRAVGARWLISAVARACNPGCKADHMLMFFGKQGVGKSRTFAILGGEWFTDDISDFGSKAAAEQLQGKWIIELPELSAMSRVEVERVKAFASRQVENYRAPWGTVAIDRPRHCVFGGTTNVFDCLKDQTGGRRSWLVSVGKIDQDALARDRDQLWAEAAQRYADGEKHYLDTDELNEAAAAEQSRHTEIEPWEDLIATYVKNKTVVTINDVCAKACGVSTQELNKHANRVGRILRGLGWRSDRQRNPLQQDLPTRIFIHPDVTVEEIRWSDISSPLTGASGPRLTGIPGGKVGA